MRTVPKWVNKIHEADKIEFSSVHTICFSPDGTQLIVGAGEKVMVYDPRDGALLQLLQAHKGPVYAVAYCKDGKKFASGSADKNVIIWTSKMEGILKYSHSEAIQCLAYNPVSYHLASCALSDFAFWSADVKAVQKYRVSGRITCCAWDHVGQHLAIGLANGAVSIRSKLGDEIHRIIRDAAVWAVTFSKSTLLVTDWNDTLSFYNVLGQQVLKERYIGLSAVSISILGALVLVGGVGGWTVLTSEGVSIFTTPLEWVWSIAPSNTLNTMAVACQDGTLWCFQIVFSTVHGLYRERYAYRENMTDVIIHHLVTGKKAKIKCHDRVQKIAIFKHRLAVQLPERVVVYEQADQHGMVYRVKEKIVQPNECSLLVATSEALLLCQDTDLAIIGAKIPKSWTVPTPIRYVKVTTLHSREVLLLGLMNGQIWQVEPSTGVAKVIMQSPGSIRCLDVNASRGRIAVVDESSVCRIYSLPNGELLYSEENVSSVSWNSWCDDMLCLSGGGVLSIKAGHFPPATQPLTGSVVGFQGGRVFCLQSNSMQTINVPMSHAVHQYVEQKMFNEAYAVACLGVTALDWERLGTAALEELSFEVARKAFQRSENIVFLTLIDQLQERFESGEKRAVIVGDVLAYCGRHTDAAHSFHNAARDDRALALFLDLRMFIKAQEYVGDGEGVTRLARQRADWARRVNEPRAAAEMYLAVGDVKRAARLLAEYGRRDVLIELARKMDKGSSESLRHLAEALVAVGEYPTAGDVYQRLGDYKRVAQLAVAAGEWSRAFALAREHADCKRDVYLPYAHRMAQEDKFVEAQRAYHMAGETATAMRVFSVLVTNAVAEERFSDAGYLHYLLAAQCLDSAGTDNNDRATLLQQYAHNERLARIYHAYDVVHRCVYEPFSLAQPDALLNAARYVLALLDGEPPPGVSMFCLYLCLAKQAKVINANILGRQMLDKLLALQVPQKFQEGVELLMLKSVGNNGSSGGEDEVAPLCWRCRRHLPPLAIQCPRCRHDLTHSLATHELLPLVRFEPAEGITHEEAVDLIERMPIPEVERGKTDGADIFRIGEDVDYTDPFLDKFDEEDEGVVECSRLALLRLSPASVVTVRRTPFPPLFYRNMMPELPITTCPVCQNLFYLEDYEIHLITKRQCPFCRHQPEDLKKDDGSRENSIVNGSGSSTPRSPSETQSTWPLSSIL
ncbi:intraflagellar transport protein 122 homolog isoform X2 [Pararge aegeria]|uniref:intraflagellar transport protein 122 homolog isoform X2 n=1 Tax=Pararge aegeria TaxID=116150 RepID=UPI0019D02781|nr:intraflagellar transport protein 122 homolog isoform X2 [Pararge aegeria]